MENQTVMRVRATVLVEPYQQGAWVACPSPTPAPQVLWWKISAATPIRVPNPESQTALTTLVEMPIRVPILVPQAAPTTWAVMPIHVLNPEPQAEQMTLVAMPLRVPTPEPKQRRG